MFIERFLMLEDSDAARTFGSSIEDLLGRADSDSEYGKEPCATQAYLQEQGVVLPSNLISVRLYELVGDPEVLIAKGWPPGELGELPGFLDRPANREAHNLKPNGCPPGTLPYSTTESVWVCLKWSVIYWGKEWVLDREGSPSGHWTFTNIQPVCLDGKKLTISVVHCLELGSGVPLIDAKRVMN